MFLGQGGHSLFTCSETFAVVCMHSLAIMDGVTDRWMNRQTDRQHSHANSRSTCMQYNRLTRKLCYCKD